MPNANVFQTIADSFEKRTGTETRPDFYAVKEDADPAVLEAVRAAHDGALPDGEVFLAFYAIADRLTEYDMTRPMTADNALWEVADSLIPDSNYHLLKWLTDAPGAVDAIEAYKEDMGEWGGDFIGIVRDGCLRWHEDIGQHVLALAAELETADNA